MSELNGVLILFARNCRFIVMNGVIGVPFFNPVNASVNTHE